MIDARVNFDAFGNCCAYCYQKGKLLAEHVVPESKGGATGAMNCVPACAQCNRAKKNQHPRIWFSRQAGFTEARWQKILSVLGVTDEYINSMFNASDDNSIKISYKLPALMGKQGIDQKTLAAKTGLSPTTVGKIYNNHFKAIDVHTVTVLMKHFQLKRLDDLFEVIMEEGEE